MSIESRKTKNGIVYDVRFRTSGKHSRQCSKTFKRMSEAREFLAKKTSELFDQRLGLDVTGRFQDTTLADEAKFWLE